MQAQQRLQSILNYFKNQKKYKMYIKYLKVFINNKDNIILKTDHKNEAYFYKWTFRKR